MHLRLHFSLAARPALDLKQPDLLFWRLHVLKQRGERVEVLARIATGAQTRRCSENGVIQWLNY
jgi:hypothetical protein